jgi:hypothetical protein
MRTDLVARLVAAPAAERIPMGFGGPIDSISRFPSQSQIRPQRPSYSMYDRRRRWR